MRQVESGMPERDQIRCGGGVWRRCVAEVCGGAWRLESPKEDGAGFPKLNRKLRHNPVNAL